MLRVGQNIIKYRYNNQSFYKRSIRSMPWELEKKKLKTEWKEGDAP